MQNSPWSYWWFCGNMPGSWMSFCTLAAEFHLSKCYSDPYKKRVLFVETGQVIRAFRAKETYIWEVLSQWWKKVRTNQKIYFFCNVVNHYQWYTEMLHTISPSRHPSNRQGCRNTQSYVILSVMLSLGTKSLDFS